MTKNNINEFKVKDFTSEIINKPREVPKKSNTPQDILTISWMFYIFAIFLLFSGILTIFVSHTFSGSFYNPSTGENEPLFGFLTNYFIFAGIFLILLSPLMFFTGRGLKRGKRWANIIAIISSLLIIINSLLSLIQGKLRSVFSLGIGVYLLYILLQKKIREFFK